MTQAVILKEGKEKAILNGHHWIFSGAVKVLPPFENGAILPVSTASHQHLGFAYFNRNSSIVGRMVSFNPSQPPLETIFFHLKQAYLLREKIIDPHKTTAFRLINGEGDHLPGLIVDQYGSFQSEGDKVFVIQVGTLGMEKIKLDITHWLIQNFHPVAIYEKSHLPSRKEEQLPRVEKLLWGTLPEELVVKENNLHFIVDIPNGQKTGFFLDQRKMRQLIRSLSLGKKVLNCFSYTGGFSVYAASGGASLVNSVDISKPALELAQKNMALNSLKGNFHFTEADVFEFLRADSLDYDLVILDPPAFAKKKKDQISACRGYKDINRVAMQKMPSGSFLLTCSCSYYIDEALFQKVIFQAAVEAGREVRILDRHHLAPDHAINICHPEGNYLKSLLLYIV